MNIDTIMSLEEFLHNFVEENSGTELRENGKPNAGYNVCLNGDIKLWSQGSVSLDENRDEAADLIEELSHAGFGSYELYSVNPKGFTLEKVEN